MPLMHSKSLVDHKLFCQNMEDLKRRLEVQRDSAAEYVEQTMQPKKSHLDILQKFGRYPHRYQCLGRQTTEDERKWLDPGGARFGK